MPVPNLKAPFFPLTCSQYLIFTSECCVLCLTIWRCPLSRLMGCLLSLFSPSSALKSTESDFSWESDDLSTCSNVSFTEFVQQYTELTEWLTQIQLVTQRRSSTLSEKYLNQVGLLLFLSPLVTIYPVTFDPMQSYHEEMLQRSPRRKLFNDYAKQLMRRYPNLREEINVRLARLNSQWAALEATISPLQQAHDETTMLRGKPHLLTFDSSPIYLKLSS